jgi:hypothetical protein
MAAIRVGCPSVMRHFAGSLSAVMGRSGLRNASVTKASDETPEQVLSTENRSHHDNTCSAVRLAVLPVRSIERVTAVREDDRRVLLAAIRI